MAVPKSKVSKQRTNTRFSTWKLSKVALVECDHCHDLKKPHEVCPKCGYYNGKPVVTVDSENK